MTLLQAFEARNAPTEREIIEAKTATLARPVLTPAQVDEMLTVRGAVLCDLVGRQKVLADEVEAARRDYLALLDEHSRPGHVIPGVGTVSVLVRAEPVRVDWRHVVVDLNGEAAAKEAEATAKAAAEKKQRRMLHVNLFE